MDREELIDLIQEMTQRVCRYGDVYDSLCIPTWRKAIDLLESEGRVEVMTRYGRELGNGVRAVDRQV